MPKFTALDAQSKCRSRLLILRAMYRILESDKFEQAVESATDKQIEKLQLILQSDSILQLREWIREAMNVPLILRSLRELRELAQQKMIPKYVRMNKAQLARALEKHETSMG